MAETTLHEPMMAPLDAFYGAAGYLSREWGDYGYRIGYVGQYGNSWKASSVRVLPHRRVAVLDRHGPIRERRTARTRLAPTRAQRGSSPVRYGWAPYPRTDGDARKVTLMHKVTLSTFPHTNTGETTWQVFVGGMPVTRETDSQAQATEWFERHCKDLSTHGRKVQRMFWDGFAAQETVL